MGCVLAKMSRHSRRRTCESLRELRSFNMLTFSGCPRLTSINLASCIVWRHSSLVEHELGREFGRLLRTLIYIYVLISLLFIRILTFFWTLDMDSSFYSSYLLAEFLWAHRRIATVRLALTSLWTISLPVHVFGWNKILVHTLPWIAGIRVAEVIIWSLLVEVVRCGQRRQLCSINLIKLVWICSIRDRWIYPLIGTFTAIRALGFPCLWTSCWFHLRDSSLTLRCIEDMGAIVVKCWWVILNNWL